MRTRSQARAEAAAARKVVQASAHRGCSADVNAKPAAEEEKVDCTICYECPSDDDIATVCGCNHKFCFSCIDYWAETKNICPLCNGEFTKVIRGSNTIAETKTYSGKKREREELADSESRLAAIRARIEENGLRQAAIQRQIDAIAMQHHLLRIESEHIQFGMEMQRLRMENMQMRTEQFRLQRSEIERMIVRIRSEIALIDDSIAFNRGLIEGRNM